MEIGNYNLMKLLKFYYISRKFEAVGKSEVAVYSEHFVLPPSNFVKKLSSLL